MPIQLEDSLWQSLTDQHCKTPMGVTAENLADQYKISREEVDAFALRSQQNWKKAHDNGYFKEEMVPIKVLITISQTIPEPDFEILSLFSCSK